MGIFQKATFDLCCDGCGVCHSESSGETYPDTDCLAFEAECSGWKNIDGKWYCPDCWDINPVTNEIEPVKTVEP